MIYELEKIIEAETGKGSIWLDYDREEDKYYLHYRREESFKNNVVEVIKKDVKKTKKFIEKLNKGKLSINPYLITQEALLDYVLSNYENPLPELKKLAKKSSYIRNYLMENYGITINNEKKDYKSILESLHVLYKGLSHPLTLGLLTLGSFILDYII